MLLGIMGFIGPGQSLFYALPQEVLTGASDVGAGETDLLLGLALLKASAGVVMVVDEFSLHMERLGGGRGSEEHITPQIGFVSRGCWSGSTWPDCVQINGSIGPNGCQIGPCLIREEYWL